MTDLLASLSSWAGSGNFTSANGGANDLVGLGLWVRVRNNERGEGDSEGGDEEGAHYLACFVRDLCEVEREEWGSR